MLKTIKYRIYPNKGQRILINKTLGCCRWVYNWSLNIKKSSYEKDKTKVSKYELMKMLPYLKKQQETEWLSEVNSQSLQQSIIRMDKAFIKFFKEKTGYPKFKSKKNPVE